MSDRVRMHSRHVAFVIKASLSLTDVNLPVSIIKPTSLADTPNEAIKSTRLQFLYTENQHCILSDVIIFNKY